MATRNVFFIDSRVSDYEELVLGLPEGSEWFLLDAEQDGVEQMASVLQGFSGLDSIQIISHGAPANLYLGSSVVTAQNLAQYETALVQIGGSLTETGDVLLYGCNVAQGEAGLAFINTLAHFTGAEVAASEDLTGAAVLGGDGELERTTGDIESAVVAVARLEKTLELSTNMLALLAGDGMVTTSFSGATDVGYSVTVQSDGKILVAGKSQNTWGSLFALARYNSDGSLDTSFSGDGGVVTAFDLPNSAYGQSVTVQVDGKILVAGTAWSNFNGTEDFALVRYNSDGSLDTSFSGDGKVTTDFSYQGAYGDRVKTYDWGISATLQADGKILVAGYTDDHFALARYNSDGSLDTNFSGDGTVTTDFGVGSKGYSVTVQADGKILVAGDSRYDFALARYNTDGSLDTSFDGDGKVTTDFFGDFNYGYSVTVQADGKILVAGDRVAGGNGDFALARYNSDGSLDTSFSGDGKVTTDFGGNEQGRSVTLQADGKILVAGYSSSYSGSDFALARYNTDGSLDTSFDGDGKVTTDFGYFDFGYSVTVQADGKILVAGQGVYYFALVRYNTDGSLDTTFSSTGLRLTEGTPDADTLYGSENADSISGLAGNDVIHPGLGNDTIDGGSGIDIVTFSGNLSAYTLTRTGSTYTVHDNSGNDGTDTLTNIERLQFADKNIALDLAPTDNAGQALLFIGVLAYDQIASPEIVGMILGYFDGGMNMQQLNQLAVNVGLVSSLAGGSSNADVARLAYQNVVGAAATTDAVDFLVSFMDGRNASFSQPEFLTAVANLDVNHAHVDLVGLAQAGIEYAVG